MSRSVNASINALKALCLASRRVTVFTGAGISTESGISDYRSQGGLWQRYQPVTIQEFLAEEGSRREYWRRKRELYGVMATVRPNQGHLALCELEKVGKLVGVITQNIDGLHQLSGIPESKICEVHGTNRNTVCLKCGDITPWEKTAALLDQNVDVPRCGKCHGLLKPNTVSFGQSLDQAVLDRAAAWAGNCDLMLVVGSTLVVEPAASLPRAAKERGARLAIVTLSETPLDGLADIKIEYAIGSVLTEALSGLT